MTAPTCRFCRAPLTQTFLDLGDQPLANSYLTKAQLESGKEGFYPLHTRVCGTCFLVQADDPVAADAIFDEGYAYFSAYSESWVAHAKRYAEAMAARFGLGPQSLVIEVASNDGYLLQHFKAMGVPVLGIEPTANTAEVAIKERGVPTEVTFFNDATGRDLKARGISADLMAGNNVLAHVPDIGDFVAGFQHVLKPEGVLTFEFPHLLNLIEKVQFDTIYHEHYSYLSLLAVEKVLHANGLRPFDVELLATHGGSLRLFCAHEASAHQETQALKDLRAREHAARLDQPAGYEGFAARVEEVRRGFLEFLAKAKSEGKTVAAYGAAAKGNTFLNYAGVTPADIVAVFDANPHKQDRFLPGTQIPIHAPAAIADFKPDYVVILPWNLKDEIMGQLAYIRDWGGQFVTAAPDTKVVG
ncbi:SAM-dependent methyltransferase [Phenylobacterium sp. Root77]|uniref:class I SAM-dependent methyltransferase n=1 Tax=unclassified Phenylobacterium TaxID=2640670 RepID=UPI0006FA799F|nr:MULTISPECIES: class I SAM-dependent methyltransferase [unclassified Phenylobacterium]KQW70798.1 SAM-dependent methyltransferase [Phenylobacterium sp. Root1277]KQW90779.1 SAM-dependent methyltransferase [Phenylobacterium sp. Root1290]KRC39588.1 SAM-dependent methyltransferase [Phenylobacterium sp. Root77]